MIRFKFAACVLMILFVAQVSAFASEKTLTFVNMSGKTFWHLHIWQSGVSGGWGAYRDFLNRPLNHGEQVKITFPEAVQNVRYWDIQVDFKDDTHLTWQRLELLKASTVAVDDKGKVHLL